MKLKKLMERVGEFLDADSKTQAEEIKSIRKVLKELKLKERALKEKIEKATKKRSGDEQDEMKIRLNVIYAQRKKGLERAKALKAQLKEKKNEKVVSATKD